MVILTSYPNEKLIGLLCTLCGRVDEPVASVGDEYGYEFCASCLRQMADELEDDNIPASNYEYDREA